MSSRDALIAGVDLCEIEIAHDNQSFRSCEQCCGSWGFNRKEFDRMMADVPAVVGDDRAESWRWLLNGLWWSGLRLREAFALTWKKGGLHVNTT